MDVINFSSLVETAKNAVELIKQSISLLPKGKERDRAGAAVEAAEKKVGELEADAAVKLGYPICRSHWPPVIMLETEKRNLFRCPMCKKETDTSPVCVGSEGLRSRFRRSLNHF